MVNVKKRVVHIITGTGVGGSENALLKTITNSKSDEIIHSVISLTSFGPMAERFRSSGISIDSINMRPGRFHIKDMISLIRNLRSKHVGLIHCWMYHANILGGIAAIILKVPCLWSIRHHSIDKDLLKRSTILIIRLGAILSHFLPKQILFNSQSALTAHVRLGYSRKKSVVIPNGFDIKYFHPDNDAKEKFIKDHNLLANTTLIGHASRFDPTKDHKTFIDAMEIVFRSFPDTCAVLCGTDINFDNEKLKKWIVKTQNKRKFILLGELSDLSEFYAALDVFVLSSISEAFPNVIGEAMSCEVPCVVTDVGDCAFIVGDTGLVVPPKDPVALSEAIGQLLADSDRRKQMGDSARQRIIEHFEISNIVREYECQLLLDKHIPIEEPGF